MRQLMRQQITPSLASRHLLSRIKRHIIAHRKGPCIDVATYLCRIGVGMDAHAAKACPDFGADLRPCVTQRSGVRTLAEAAAL